MTLTQEERGMLATLADVLIPAGNGFPSASEAGVAGAELDQVLAVRPDLIEPLRKLVATARGHSGADFVNQLQQNDPAAFGILAELVPGAYFLNPAVRARLNYQGQNPRPIDPREDYLDDGLLQSVLDRGPVYRPPPKNGGGIAGYDWRRSYDWNYAHVPEPIETSDKPVPGQWDYCGLATDSPLGIAAGPLLNGRWILYYASLGFDALTYKTVRSRERAAYPLPNLQPVKSDSLREPGRTLSVSDEMEGSWAVSFGMPSRPPDIWRADIERTRRALPKGKVLSVSVVATPEPGWTLEELANDFAFCAKWAVESGADCVEANFSCPNVLTPDGQLYQNPENAGLVAARLREAVGAKPVLIKIGQITDRSLASSLARSLTPHANALVMVNCITAKVSDAGRAVFEGQARGIAGPSIYEAALAQIRLFSEVVREQNSPIQLVGVGGISSAEQVQAFLRAGCHSVQLATAAMVNPEIGREIRRILTL